MEEICEFECRCRNVLYPMYLLVTCGSTTQNALLLLYCNTGYANAPPYNVIRTLPMLFFF